MKLWIGVLMAAALVAAEKPAGDSKGKAAAGKPAAQAAKRPAPVIALPKDAVEVEPGTWRHQADGKTWIYRKTPFGLSRFEEKAAKAEKEESKAAPGSDVSAGMRAFDDGEYVRFERPGPFGVYKWRRKKTELDAGEKQAWSRAQAGENK